MGWIDNRDIRDDNYKGELILLENSQFAVTKEEALFKMKQIIEGDISFAKARIETLENEIEYQKNKIKLASARLPEFE